MTNLLEPVHKLYNELPEKLRHSCPLMYNFMEREAITFRLNTLLKHPVISIIFGNQVLCDIHFDLFNNQYYTHWTASEEFLYSCTKEERELYHNTITDQTAGIIEISERINILIQPFNFPYERRVYLNNHEEAVNYLHFIMHLYLLDDHLSPQAHGGNYV